MILWPSFLQGLILLLQLSICLLRVVGVSGALGPCLVGASGPGIQVWLVSASRFFFETTLSEENPSRGQDHVSNN